MKNLKVNKNKVKALIGTMILSTNLVACGFTQSSGNNNKESYSSSDSIITQSGAQYLFVNDQLISISDVKLVDSNKTVINKVDGVLVDDKIMNIDNPVLIKFNNDIEKVLIGNELLSVNEFALVYGNTLEEINLKDIQGVFVNDQLISFEGRKGYDEVSSEEFYQFAHDLYVNLVNEGLSVSEEDVIKYAMIVNIDQLSEVNPELRDEIVGIQDSDEVFQDANMVLSAIMSENSARWCERGLGMDSLIKASIAVINPKQKELTMEVENRMIECFANVGDSNKYNELVDKLLMDMLDQGNELFNFESGTGYNNMYININTIRLYDLVNNNLNDENSELIKYLIVYAGDGEVYEENSKSTGYFRSINELLGECTNSKTKTR